MWTVNKPKGWRFVILCCVFSIGPLVTTSVTRATEYASIEWTDLIPKEDLDTLLAPPEFLNEVADGSAGDSLTALAQHDQQDTETQRYLNALRSTRIMPEYNGLAIRIPGYIVPLEQNETKDVTAFFIVPYFGACLHIPPPPPNQILYVRFEQGIAFDALQYPMWFEGNLRIALTEHNLGTAAYELQLHRYTLYE